MSNTENTKSKSPSHFVYHVRNADNGKGFWTKIGAAWAHSDGKGLNVQIDVVPLDGRITLRVESEQNQ